MQNKIRGTTSESPIISMKKQSLASQTLGFIVFYRKIVWRFLTLSQDFGELRFRWMSILKF